MATPSNKHNNGREVLAQKVFYSSFDGGLNLSASPETIAKNELLDAVNVEISHSTGRLKVRGGLVWLNRFSLESGDSVDEVIPIQGSEDFLMLSKSKKLFHYMNGVIYNTGFSLDSSLSNMNAAMWDNVILLAYGLALEKLTIENNIYNWSPIAISDAPTNCRYVFVRNGRVGVVDGDNTIRYSAVGDCESWVDDPDDDSSGKFLDVGYKDGMKITAVCPLSKDLIVFKSSLEAPDCGTVFRVVGDYPDWQVVEAVHNTGTYNYKTVKIVSNDVFYVTESGLATLSTVMEYGDVKMNWIDRKVSEALTSLITSSAQLWKVASKNQLWLAPSETDDLIWVFDYRFKLWTCFKFNKLPKYVLCVRIFA